MAPLNRVRQLFIDSRGMVIQGIEETWRRKNRTDHRQTLWCWPVDPSEAIARDRRDAIDMEEEALHLAGALRR